MRYLISPFCRDDYITSTSYSPRSICAHARIPGPDHVPLRQVLQVQAAQEQISSTRIWNRLKKDIHSSPRSTRREEHVQSSGTTTFPSMFIFLSVDKASPGVNL